MTRHTPARHVRARARRIRQLRALRPALCNAEIRDELRADDAPPNVPDAPDPHAMFRLWGITEIA